MAHQAHNIPWHLLASNLRWEAPGPFDNFATNLYPRGKPHQANDLNRFVDAFVRNLDEHAVCERRKYPEKYDIPQPSDLILDEATVRKIAPTVRRWRGKWARGSECPSGVCNLRDGLEACECEPIPSEERFMSAFLRPLVDNECYQFYEENGDAFFNLEVVKTLLLYGEMDAILRVCAHPDICLRRWFSRAPCYDTGGDDLGWNLICYKMLSVYICLNVAYAFPELWDFNSGRTPERDYRNTRFYQKTLINCAIGRRWDESVLATFPHRRFFDMDSSRESLETNTGNGEHWLLNRELHRRRRYKFKGYPASGDLLSSSTDRYKEDHGLYGRVPIHEFLDLWLPGAGSHKPSADDTHAVRSLLCSKGLPMELALKVMRLADYEPPRSKHNVPHDPLHPSNREELGNYLKYCWQTLVRCYMMGKELGMNTTEHGYNSGESINWKVMVARTIIRLFRHQREGKAKFTSDGFVVAKSPRTWWEWGVPIGAADGEYRLMFVQ